MTSVFNIEIISTNKGTPGTLVDDFRFRTDKVTKTTVLWWCAKTGCDARCKTDLEHKSILGGKT